MTLYNLQSGLLYTLGPPLKGQLWETTAVPAIREQAAALAEEIITKITRNNKQLATVP